MASKNKTPPGSGRSPREEVDRLIARGKYKDAVKEAKLCHRANPTPEHHHLLEQAYFLRAKQLLDAGMPTAAAEVAGHLLDFGITDPTLTEPTAALLMAVGLTKQAITLQGRLDSPEALDRLARQGADQAVLHPDRAASPEAREVANRVRAALGDPAALDGLKDISRTSPFADWRLFARGLAAFRRGDDAEALTSWDRLDPARAASRIARGLSEVTAAVPRDAPPSPKIEALERRVFGEPLLGPLQDLGELVAQELWLEAIRKLPAARIPLRRLDPTLADRLTRSLYWPIIREARELSLEAGQGLVKAFLKAAEPLPIDPRWNRLWAMVWDGPQGHPEESEPFWRKYLNDLDTVTVLRPEERAKAKALVLTSMADEWADLARWLASDQDEGPGGTVDEAAEARRKAASLLEESLRLFPEHRATYQALMDVHKDAGQPDRVAAVAGRLVGAFPEDFDALILLAEHHFGRDEPAKGLEFAIRARKLKPLDRQALSHEWACRTAMARHHALDGRWDEGRGELDLAAGLMPELAGSAHFDARRACLEFKAGQAGAARAILDEAIQRPAGPAPVWLAMAIEARRFRLPEAEIARFEAQWQAAASGKVQGEAAGALAGIMGSFLASKTDYPGRETHEKQVIDYLGRTTRIKYALDDLRSACGLLGGMPGHQDLLSKLAKRGVKLFPDTPEFPTMLGTVELAKGPSRPSLRAARRHFESALKLAQARESSDPKVAEMIPPIRHTLTAIDEAEKAMWGAPFGLGGGDGRSFLDAFRAMMEREADFDDDDFDDRPPAPTPRPQPKGKKR